MRYDVPLYNNPDGTHCFQASLRSILKFFEPHKNFTFKQLDKITAKEKGLWTWPMAGELWLKESGYEVKKIERFDYARLAEIGGDYLVELFGPKVAHEQIIHSNMSVEINRARDFAGKIDISQRLPGIEDIRKYLGEGFLVWCVINSRKLSGSAGYVGHFVVVTGYDENGLYINDSGGRVRHAQKDLYLTYSKFLDCWADPNDSAKNLTAVKK